MNPFPGVESFVNLLLRQTLEASVLIAIVLLFQLLFRRQLTARWRFALWWLVLAALVLPVRPASSFSIFNYLQASYSIQGPRYDVTEKQTASVEVAISQRETETEITPVDSSNIEVADNQIALAPTGEMLSEGPPRSSMSRFLGIPGREVDADDLFLLILLGVWVAGIVVLSAYVGRLVFRFRRQLSRHCTPVSDEVQSVFDECRQSLQVRRKVELLETEAVQSPALYGLFRLQLLLPKGMSANFTPAELRHIFLHELAHVKRGDMWLNWLVTGLQIIHWFNPVVWFAFARLRADRELACDELALIHSGEAHGQNYGQTVLKLLENLSRIKPSPGLVGIVEDRRQMASRLKMIAAFRLPSKWSKLAVVLLLGLGLIGLTGAQTPVRKPKDTNTVTPAMAVSASAEQQPQNTTVSQAQPEAASVLKGKVLDAATRHPIKSFSISKWEMIRTGPDNPTNLVVRSETGSFLIPLHSSSKRVRLNFLVPGYEAAQLNVTAEQLQSEHEVLLKAGTDYQGRVLLPDGTPAVAAQVGCITPNNILRLGNRRIEFQFGEIMFLSDSDGTFEHVQMADCRAIIAVHEQGFVRMPIEAFKKNPVLRLEPWGRVEGVFKNGDQPWGGQDIMLRPMKVDMDGVELQLTPAAFQVVTDVEGKFAFASVPPGELTLLRTFRASPTNSWTQFFLDTSHGTNLVVSPGKTSFVSLGGDGMRVLGKASIKGQPWNWSNTRLFASLEMIPVTISLPGGLHSDKDIKAYTQSEAFQKALRARRAYTFSVNEDGALEVWDVPPGTYQLILEAKQNFEPPGAQVSPSRLKLLANLNKEVVIPEPAAGKPAVFNLDELVLDSANAQAARPIRPAEKREASAKQIEPAGEAPQLRVQVLDNESGKPLSDARVSTGKTSATTDKDGYASIPKPAVSDASFMYEIRIRRSGYAAREIKWSSLQQDKRSNVPDRYSVRLDEGTTIGGYVRDGAGKGIAEAVVEISGPSRQVMVVRESLLEGTDFAKVTTDAQGKWIFDQAPKKFEDLKFTVLHPKYERGMFKIDNANEPTTGSVTLKMSDLAAKNAVMALKAGVEVSGHVVDQDGKPVDGVKITINREWNESNGSITNGPDGRFRISNASIPRYFIPGLPPKSMSLTLQAAGYAAKTEAVLLDPVPKELAIVMVPGKTLRGIVMNSEGTAITNGYFMIDEPSGVGQPPYSFSTRTDGEGRIIWTSAPVEPVAASVSAPGYRPLQVTNWVANGIERKVVLSKMTGSGGKVMKGRVLDAVTKQPIKEFSLLWATATGSSGTIPMQFRTGNYKVPIFSAGSYVKATFSATGYQPQIITFTADQLDKDQEVMLEPGKDYEGRVLLPDGTPAVGASVVFSTGRNPATVGYKRFETRTGPKAVDVDGTGKFRHPQVGDCRGIAAIHDHGVAMVSLDDFMKDPTIRLQPWGRVEGTLHIGKEITAGEDLWLQPLVSLRSGERIELSGAKFSVKSDAAGQFVFEYVPPGEYKLFRIVRAGPVVPIDGSLGQAELLAISHGGTFSHDTLVIVGPGEVVRISMGGKGALVRARVFMPEKGPFDWAGTSLVATLEKSPVQWPWKVENRNPKPGESTEYMRSEAYHSAMKARQNYAFSVEADGLISAHDVPPGSYRLELRVERKLDTSSNVIFRGARVVAGFTNDVVVIPSGATTDLGELHLIPSKKN